MYCANNTANDILCDPDTGKYLPLFFPDFFVDMLSEEDKELLISQLPSRVFTPWGQPFPAEELLNAGNEAEKIVSDHKYSFLPLWSEQAETEIPFRTNQKASVCILTTNTLTQRRKPAVLIVPGGGYEMTSMNQEGIQIAEAFEKAGYAAFVLYYRVAPHRFPEPQKDLALAVRTLRVNAERFCIDPQDLLLVGFSAGGHLIASYTAWEERISEALFEDPDWLKVRDRDKLRQISGKPDKLCLGYPVISFRRDIAHEPSFQALTGGDETLREVLSMERHVSEDWPKTYLWTCQTDELVNADNTRVLARALTERQIDHRCHIFKSGFHGVGLGVGLECGVWVQEAIEFFRGKVDQVQPEYFARKVDEGTWLIGCDEFSLGRRTGKSIEFGEASGNSWLIDGKDYAVLLDSAGELGGLRRFAEWVACKPVRCYLTHAHPDHIYHIGEFDEFWVHPADKALLTEEAIGQYAFTKPDPLPDTVHELSDGEVLNLGEDHNLTVIHFPGHTDGSVLYYDRKTRLLFSGDSVARRLLYGTCGYVPLPDYIGQLKQLKALDVRGICSCHDRRVLAPELIDFLCSALTKLPDADTKVQFTPEMVPLYVITVGDPTGMFYLDSSFPETVRPLVLADRARLKTI